jgi:hypothetical protein
MKPPKFTKDENAAIGKILDDMPGLTISLTGEDALFLFDSVVLNANNGDKEAVLLTCSMLGAACRFMGAVDGARKVYEALNEANKMNGGKEFPEILRTIFTHYNEFVLSKAPEARRALGFQDEGYQGEETKQE